jgi:uncharacterized protein (TIGR03435 family)
MTSDERALKELMGRRSPSHLEFVAARDRVIHELRATPAGRLTPRIGDAVAPAPRWRTRLALAAVLVLGVVVWSGVVWPSLAFTRIPIFESFMRGMSQTAGRLSPFGAQNADTGPQFEEASIRECDPDNLPALPPGARGGGPNSFYMTPGRTYVLCMTPATLIRTAYGLGAAGNELLNDGSRARPVRLNAVAGLGVENGTMVRGGPDWVRSDRYTIEATADPAADAATMSRTMMLRLIERRFKLRAHLEVEQIPAFALTVAKGGHKLKRTEDGGCEVPVFVPGQQTPPPPSLAEVRRGVKPRCGIILEPNGPNLVYFGAGAIISGGEEFTSLAKRIGLRLDRVQVFDKTGLTGTYTFTLEFPNDAGIAPSDPARAANLVAALEDQLGLKLEPARAPREFVVIDSIERPGAN